MYNFSISTLCISHDIARWKLEGFFLVFLLVGDLSNIIWMEGNYPVVVYTHRYLTSGLRAKRCVLLFRRNRIALVQSLSHSRKNNITYKNNLCMEKHEMLPKQWVHYSVVDHFAPIQWSCSSPTGTVTLSSLLSLHCLIYCLQKQEAQERINLKQITEIN